jgi:hypothetical protein
MNPPSGAGTRFKKAWRSHSKDIPKACGIHRKRRMP